MTRLERREHALRKLRRKGKAAFVGEAKGTKGSTGRLTSNVPFEDSEALPYTAPEAHHHISKSQNYHMNIMAFLSSNNGDPAIAVSVNILAIC